jgi:hypothetical protein
MLQARYRRIKRVVTWMLAKKGIPENRRLCLVSDRGFNGRQDLLWMRRGFASPSRKCTRCSLPKLRKTRPLHNRGSPSLDQRHANGLWIQSREVKVGVWPEVNELENQPFRVEIGQTIIDHSITVEWRWISSTVRIYIPSNKRGIYGRSTLLHLISHVVRFGKEARID